MEKVNNVIDIIKNMDLKNKLRLGVLFAESNFELSMYNKNDLKNYFDTLLKENDEEYGEAIINFNKYKVANFTMAKIMEMNTEEQNRVVLFLFNNIERSINKI